MTPVAAGSATAQRGRTLVAVTLLGFSSGLPLALSGGTLEAWCAVSGLSLKTIGFIKLAAFAYVFKFLWSPLIDRYWPPLLGRRRGWMLAMQIGLMATLVFMAGLSPESALLTLAGAAVVLATFSATQDIAIDAYRADQLAPLDRGLGSALSVGIGYRLAMLASGGLALVFAAHAGWHLTYLAMAALMAVGVIGTLLAPEAPSTIAPPANLARAYIEPWREFLSRPAALGWLAFIVLYKLGSAFGLSLSTTFLLRGAGYELNVVGWVNKIFALIAMVAGSLVAGALLERWSLWRATLVFGIAQGVAILGFFALALGWHGLPALVIAVATENFGSGLGTIALLAVLLGLCNKRFSATQFALFTALDSLARVFVGPIAGMVAQDYGWPAYFGVALACAVPGLLLLVKLRPQFARIEATAAEA